MWFFQIPVLPYLLVPPFPLPDAPPKTPYMGYGGMLTTVPVSTVFVLFSAADRHTQSDYVFDYDSLRTVPIIVDASVRCGQSNTTTMRVLDTALPLCRDVLSLPV